MNVEVGQLRAGKPDGKLPEYFCVVIEPYHLEFGVLDEDGWRVYSNLGMAWFSDADLKEHTEVIDEAG
jgi:hypothetical protein